MFVSLAALLANVLTARNQRRLNALGFLRQYHADVRKWADEVLDAMSEAHSACYLKPAKMAPGEFFELRHRLLWKLSSLTDRGRFFFPNDDNAYGAWKLPPFRGFRHEALDHVLGVFRELIKLDASQSEGFDSNRSVIEGHRKAFVAQLAEALGPHAYRAQAEQLSRAVGFGSNASTRYADT